LIRVRFAPSPTGYLHIGGVRTALFNYLYARNQEGKFLLRIEDTDRERSKPEFETEILESLEWLGLKWDEPIVRQSEKIAHYAELARDLVARGLAYEEKAAGKTAVKFKMPKKKAIFDDQVHGSVEFDTGLFDDLVIIKSDGYPTYHWACVVDDHEMNITHVIRGDDHLSNTPRQVQLFEAMGWKPPKYAHLPLIMGEDGTPLSKRHGAVALSHYRREGFLQEGIMNYLALLGWGVEGNQELYSLEELIKKFSLKRINKTNARFNLEKLEWMNAQHIKRLPDADYLARLSAFYSDESNKIPAEKWKKLSALYRSRIKTFTDLRQQAGYCFADIESYEPQQTRSFLDNKPLKRHLELWAEKAGELASFEDPLEIEKLTRDFAQGWGIEARDLIHPLRFAVTGKTVSPSLFDLMSVLSRETCVKRVKKFLTQ